MMTRTPQVLDLILLHLQEHNCKVHAMMLQSGCGLITVTVGTQDFHISEIDPLLIRITTNGKDLAKLDVLDPTTFDKLDAILGIKPQSPHEITSTLDENPNSALVR